MFSDGLSMPMLPLYAATFTTVLLLIGIVGSSYWAIRAAFEIPFGTISEYVGRKKPIVIGTLLGVVGAVLCATADNVFLIVLGQAIWGVGGAAFFCVSLTMITELAPLRSRGKAMGVLQAVEWIGSTTGASLSGVVASLLGYRGLFWTSTAIAFAAFASSLCLRSSGEKRMDGKPLTVLKRSFEKIPALGNSTMLIICLIIFSMMMKNTGLSTIVPLYTRFHLGMTLTELSLIMASRSVGVILGTVSGGWLSDRIGRAQVLVIGLILTTLSVFFIPMTSMLVILALLMCMHGVSFGYAYCTTPILVTEMFQSMMGLSIGLYRTFFDLGGLMGPFIVMAIVSSHGYIVAFYAMAGLMLLNLVISLLLRRKTTS